MPTDRVATFLASVIAHARVAHDPQWYRPALIAESLLGRMQEINEGGIARAMGYDGPTGTLSRTGIATDALRQSQASLDSPEPDLASVKTGIAAARALIGTKATQRGDGARYLFGLMLGKSGGLAPEHLSGAEHQDEQWPDEEDEEHCANCGAWLDEEPGDGGLCPECAR